jgi:four helix bundle protein
VRARRALRNSGTVRASSVCMSTVRSPQDLIAWQLCEELADLVVEITATGPAARDRDFCDQVRRSSRGPGPNIAEGFGRQTPREFARYLRTAVGSLLETSTWLQRGDRQRYWKPETYARVKSLCDRALDITRKLLASKLRQIKQQEQMEAARRQRSGTKRLS